MKAKRIIVVLLVVFALAGLAHGVLSQPGRRYLCETAAGDVETMTFSAAGRELTITDPEEIRAIQERMNGFRVSRYYRGLKTGESIIGIVFTYKNGSTKQISLPYFELDGKTYKAVCGGQPAYLPQIFSDEAVYAEDFWVKQP